VESVVLIGAHAAAATGPESMGPSQEHEVQCTVSHMWKRGPTPAVCVCVCTLCVRVVCLCILNLSVY